MARFCAEKITPPKFKAASQWKEQCLLGHGSLFSSEAIWNADNVKALMDNFVNKPDEGDGDFFEKLEGQLSGTKPQVKMLAAEMLWFMLICPSNIGVGSKHDSISRVWAWSGNNLDQSSPLLAEDVLDGIGSSGTAYNTNRWREFGYFTRVLEALYKLDTSRQKELLSDGWALAKWLEAIPENDARQLRHMILFLLFPDDFERIFGGTDRRAVVKAFTNRTSAQMKKFSALEIDIELQSIRQKQVTDFGTAQLDFYIPPLKEMWKGGASTHWLFAWNPNNFVWNEINDEIAQIENGKTVIGRWSCSNLNMSPGDRAWLIRVGVEPKGIMATGNVISEPYEADHYEPEKAKQGKTCNYVDIEFTKILDVFKDTFVELQDLERITIDKQTWVPQSSGIEIHDRSAGLLEKLWNQVARSNSSKVSEPLPIMKHEPKNLIL
ncbi:MAG: EVE domain-containing protein, partial [Pseudomonadales bacterium]|nr:EVE domain-containing protein [Pseudomonadales bacterium]